MMQVNSMVNYIFCFCCRFVFFNFSDIIFFLWKNFDQLNQTKLDITGDKTKCYDTKKEQDFLCFKNDLTAIQATDICSVSRNVTNHYYVLLCRTILSESIRGKHGCGSVGKVCSSSATRRCSLSSSPIALESCWCRPSRN